MVLKSKLKLLGLLAAASVALAGYAFSQAGQGTLTTLLSTYYAEIQVPNSALTNNTSLATLRNFISTDATCASYYFTGINNAAPTTAVDQVFFIATRALKVTSVSEVHSAAAGGASTLQLVKDTGTAAPGTGTDLLTNNTNAGFDLNGTANTVQVGALVATAATVTLAAGDRLSVDFANAIQSSVGVTVTACMTPP